MLDLSYIQQNADLIKANNAVRHVSVDVDELVRLAVERKKLIAAGDLIRATGKSLAGANRSEHDVSKARQLKEDERVVRSELVDVEAKIATLQTRIPNLTHPATPRGAEESFAVLSAPDAGSLRTRPPEGDHVDIMTRAKLLDMEAGSAVSGAGFYFLRNEAVLLEMALVQYALAKAKVHGFDLCTTPELVREDVLVGTGFSPRGEETNTYLIADSDLCLIGTAEMPLCGQFRDKVIESLPVRTCGVSHCFRTERAAGRATRGLYRVHQFTKVELVVICDPLHSESEHRNLLELERSIFDGLDIPYRVIDVASADLGASAYRKFDMEAWMPGRGENGAFGEVTSASNCLDYQARRLGIRYRAGGGKPQLAHTLNGTAIATGRAMIALIENHVHGDNMKIPPALQPYFGSDTLKL